MTCFPNLLGHHTQAFAKKKLDDISYLLKCSPYMKEYICSIYVPKCHPSKELHLPCPSFKNYISERSPECQEFDIPGLFELAVLDINDSYCYAPQIHGEYQ